ncbi:hypothetical protein DFH29DRAFT_1047593 [Suillus ampliporus]|nr:hypothetical protein DFH29DRAFT_1047593 [Suillus ampliporus]
MAPSHCCDCVAAVQCTVLVCCHLYEFVSSIPPSGPACSQGTDPFTPYAGGYLDHPPPPLVSPALTRTVAQQTTICSPAFTIKYVHHSGDLLGMMPGITAVKPSGVYPTTPPSAPQHSAWPSSSIVHALAPAVLPAPAQTQTSLISDALAHAVMMILEWLLYMIYVLPRVNFTTTYEAAQLKYVRLVVPSLN